jgi:hypothetical protein
MDIPIIYLISEHRLLMSSIVSTLFQTNQFRAIFRKCPFHSKMFSLFFVSKRQREAMASLNIFSFRSIGPYFQSIFLDLIHFDDTVTVLKIRFFLKDYYKY